MSMHLIVALWLLYRTSKENRGCRDIYSFQRKPDRDRGGAYSSNILIISKIKAKSFMRPPNPKLLNLTEAERPSCQGTELSLRDIDTE